MEKILLFFKSFFIGLAIAAPVGPIGILCINKTLERGFIGAVLVGCGAALADVLYGIVAMFSLQCISVFLFLHKDVLKLFGGIFLFYCAAKESTKKIELNYLQKNKQSNLATMLSVFLLTIVNPMTICSFMAIFSTLSANNTSHKSASIILLGILLGSFFWWCILGAIIIKIKTVLSFKSLTKIKYLSTLLIAFFAAYSSYSGLKNLIFK